MEAIRLINAFHSVMVRITLIHTVSVIIASWVRIWCALSMVYDRKTEVVEV
jgi:hypothetical protein